jgi:hypothetical protein
VVLNKTVRINTLPDEKVCIPSNLAESSRLSSCLLDEIVQDFIFNIVPLHDEEPQQQPPQPMVKIPEGLLEVPVLRERIVWAVQELRGGDGHEVLHPRGQVDSLVLL